MLEKSEIFHSAKRANYNHNCMFQISTNDIINIDFKSFGYFWSKKGGKTKQNLELKISIWGGVCGINTQERF